MKAHRLWKQNRRLVICTALGVLTLIATSSPWFTTIVYACQNQGGGC